MVIPCLYSVDEVRVVSELLVKLVLPGCIIQEEQLVCSIERPRKEVACIESCQGAHTALMEEHALLKHKVVAKDRLRIGLVALNVIRIILRSKQTGIYHIILLS
jgi:hypothetical protein